MKLSEKLILTFIVSIAAIGLLLGVYSLFKMPKETANVILSDKPIHWHPHLEIIIKNEKIIIPANIGIGGEYSDSPFYDSMMSMTNMHTHDTTGKLHWEVMMHAPTAKDLYLGNFFEVWGEIFNRECIFKFCNGPDGNVKMSVNGKSNNEFEKYVVRDGDNIIIEFTTKS